MTSARQGVLLVAVAAILTACPSGDAPSEPHVGTPKRVSPGSGTAWAAGTTLDVPSSWSYSLTRHGQSSWSFALSPASFNPGNRCAPKTGALDPKLLARGGVFISGQAYEASFPPAANRYRQTPGSFRLNRRTLARYETLGCHPTYRIDFAVRGYYFFLNVAVSPSAGRGRIERALEVLNSIR